jgi:hypothetical protein
VELLDRLAHPRVRKTSYQVHAAARQARGEPPRSDYPYPLAHVHFNGTLTDGTRLDRLHVPTRRVPLELVVWHLVAEWGVERKGDDWRAVLEESIAGFDERRSAN